MSSDDSDEDFVSYGTALEPLDEGCLPRKKAFTLEDQVARDSKGRRRFHGAFTGGFSAGFMNSVGSLEGWKPSEFKSSRKDRKETVTQRPEQFMDDEDIGEFGIAPQRLTARSEYTKNFDKPYKRPLPQVTEGPIPGNPVLDELLRPARQTVGVRLLKNMGWRPGQGVGPRITKKEKQKRYGCELPPGDDDSNSDDDEEEFEKVTYAPDDVRPFVTCPKKNTFGLGYSGLEKRSVLGQTTVSSELKFTDRNKKVNIRGQAFGVGAFEAEDEDIYSKEDMSQYDFELCDESSPRKAITTSAVPGVLEGFTLSKTKFMKKLFAAPVLPCGFKPRHNVKKSRFSPLTSSKLQPKVPSGLGRHDLNAETRASILEESNQQATPVERILPPSEIKVEPGTSSQLSTFRPFQADPDKQRRYELYLALSDKGKLSELQPVSMNQWEKDREEREFKQAERIFQPLTGIMSDRFTQASQSEDLNNPLATVEKIKHGKEARNDAAKMKMYGPLTRETFSWRPSSLLCKRFNVPDPESDSTTPSQQRKPKYSIFDSLDHLVNKKDQLKLPADPSPIEELCDESASPHTRQEASNEPSIVQDAGGVDQQEPLFADPVSKVDLFKAIFLDSSDDEDNANAEASQQSPEITYDEPIRNVARNQSPPRGLFANVDLEALTTRPSHIPPPQPITIEPKQGDQAEKSSDTEILYGPKLPDKIVPKQCKEPSPLQSSSDDSWVEKHGNRSKKTKKSRKEKKHKSKHKKKKKYR